MNKTYKYLVCCLALLASVLTLPAHSQPGRLLEGRVVDARTGTGLEYATVEIRTAADSTLAGGCLTDGEGRFRLPVRQKGRYLLCSHFIGYEPATQEIDWRGEAEHVRIEMKESSLALDEVVVRGYTDKERLLRSAYNVQALETEGLKSTTMELSQAIDKISGVKIRSTGGVGSEADVTLNGFSGRHVKVFIDGVPMDGMNAAFGLNNIPAGLAKRVEVYKGVVPIELGGDALGGAINIVTDRSRRTRVDASYSFGSFNTHKSNVYAEWTSPQGVYLSLNAYQNYSDNDYRVDIDHYTDFNTNSVIYKDTTVRRFHARYHNEAAILKAGVVDKPWADRLLIGFTGGYEYKQTQNASNMNWVYGARYTTAQTLMPHLVYEKRFRVLQGLNVSLNAHYNFGQSYAADTASCNYNWLGERGKPKNTKGELAYTKYRYRDNNAAANLRASLRPATGHLAAFSATLTSFSRSGKDETEYQADYDYPQKSLKVVSGLSYKYDHQGQWNVSAFAKNYVNHLEAYLDPEGGSNYQHFASTESYWGGGFASTYFLGERTQARASYEYALRLPTSRELFGSGDDIERGNESLKPEKSNNVNIGATVTPLDRGGHRLSIDATFQYREIKDYIRRTTNSDNGRATSNNEGGVRSLGGDFGLRYTFRSLLYAGGNLSYFDMRSMSRYRAGTQTESLNYKERIPAIPYLYGNGEAGITLRDVFGKNTVLDIRYMCTYVHRFNYEWNTYHNDELEVPSQLSHDLFVNCTFGKRQEFTVAAECTNLSDERLYDNFKMQKPGRAFALKVAYRFIK